MQLRSGRLLSGATTAAVEGKKRLRSHSVSDDKTGVLQSPAHKRQRTGSSRIITPSPSQSGHVSPKRENPKPVEPILFRLHHTGPRPLPDDSLSSLGSSDSLWGVEDDDEEDEIPASSTYQEDVNITLPEPTGVLYISLGELDADTPIPLDIFSNCRTCNAALWQCDHGTSSPESPLQSPKTRIAPSLLAPPLPVPFIPLPSEIPVISVPASDIFGSSSVIPSEPEPIIQPFWTIHMSIFWPEIYHSIKYPDDNPSIKLRSACSFCHQALDIFGVFQAPQDDQNSHNHSGRNVEPAVVLHCGHVLGANCMHTAASLGNRLCPVCSFDTACRACHVPVYLPLPTAAQGPRPLGWTLAQMENLRDGLHPTRPAYCPPCDQHAQYDAALHRREFPSLLAHRTLAAPLFRLANSAIRAQGVVNPADEAAARAVACAVAEHVEDNFRSLFEASRAWDRLTRAEETPWGAPCAGLAPEPGREWGGRYAGLGIEDAFHTFMDPHCERDRAADRAKVAARDAHMAERIRAAFETDFQRSRAAYAEQQQHGRRPL